MGLSDLKQIKCKTCGEPLDLSKANGSVIKCGVCDSVFTLPKFTADQKVLDYLFQAEGDLDTGKFDDAYTKFAKAAELDKTEPEAYWGMVLAEHKIQYLKDEVNKRLQPVCHEINNKKFKENKNYLTACKYADDGQKKAYEAKADEIDYIKSEFKKLQSKGVKYDCFICVKVSDDETQHKTEDYYTAYDIYHILKDKGYKPFFSEAVLKNETGADYEAHILYALYSSGCMLVVCFDEGYLRTKWVKNEYSRYLGLIYDEEKEGDSIALVYSGSPVEKLPNKKGKLQGIDINKLTAMEQIITFVKNHLPAEKSAESVLVVKPKVEPAVDNKDTKTNKSTRITADKINAHNDKVLKQAAKTAAMRDAEEAARKTAEREAEEKKEEEERKKREAKEARRAEWEKKQREEAERKDREQAAIIACDFEIENDVLKKYKGNAAEVIIPDSVTIIGYLAFSSCYGLESIIIPNSVTGISERAFEGCSGLESITVGSENAIYKSENNCILTKDGKNLILGCKNSVIPNSVTSIGDCAFGGCSGLTSITIPNSVTSIGDSTFEGCSGLESITVGSENAIYKSENNCILTKDGKNLILGCKNSIIPKSVTSIGDRAFSGCRGLESITIPNSVKNIGWWVFYGCSGLTSITLPIRVTNIGGDAFLGCSGLTSINYGGSKKQWKALCEGMKWDFGTGDYTVYFGRGLVKKMEKGK